MQYTLVLSIGGRWEFIFYFDITLKTFSQWQWKEMYLRSLTYHVGNMQVEIWAVPMLRYFKFVSNNIDFMHSAALLTGIVSN